MIRKCIGIAAVVLIVLAGSGCRKKEVVIGALVSTSSAQGTANDGVELLRGMELAVEEINANGGLNGVPMVIAHTDVKTNTEEAQIAFKAMENEQKPLVYVTTLSSITLAVSEQAEESGAPLLATIASAPGICNDKKWIFRFWPQTTDEIDATLRLFEQIKPSSLAMIYSDEAYGQSFVSSFTEPLTEKGFDPKFIPYPSDSDFSHVQNWDLGRFDTLFAVGFSSHLMKLIPAIRAAGYTGQIVANNAMSTPLARALPSMEGVYLTTSAIYNKGLPISNQLAQAYLEEYGQDVSHYAATGYDAVHIIAGILENNEISRETLRKELEKGFVSPGANGTIDAKPGNHDFTFPFYPVQIRNGRVEYL